MIGLILSFSVIRTPKRMDYVVHYVRQHANENGIIYCATRKDVDRVYENLTRAGIKRALPWGAQRRGAP